MAYSKNRRARLLAEECGALDPAAVKIAALGTFRHQGRLILDGQGREVCRIELPDTNPRKVLPLPALTAHQLDVFTALIVRQLNKG